MAILTGLGTAFKRALLESMLGDTFKIALYTSSATLSMATESYTSSGEVKGQGYSPGGQVLRGARVRANGVEACLEFDGPVVWKNATIRARGAMIYNASKGGLVVGVADFDQDVTSTNGNFTVPIPPDFICIA